MYHTLSITEAYKKLKTRQDGLTTEEVKALTETYGLNELHEPAKDPLWKKFLEQFKDFLILILIAAVVVSALVGEWIDAIAILVILIVNAILGFVQEYRAEQALEALKKMSADYAKVLRDGKIQKIPVKELVPGDVFILETGDKVPADARLIESVNLKVSESILTGESEVLHKTTEELDESIEHLGDMRNIVFKDTSIMYGRGKAVTFATGMNTEVGKIADKLLSTEEQPSPLSIEIDNTGKKIGIAILFICALVFGVGFILKTAGVLEIFLIAIALAVAAIPEGLPAVVTIVLALGIKRLAQQKAIMKKLHAVETLGSTTHICSDKTGTLTQNSMVVQKIWLPNASYTITGQKYDPHGTFLKNGKELKEIRQDQELQTILQIGALCNDSSLRFDEEKKIWQMIGDPTEGSLVTVALKSGMKVEEIKTAMPRISEIPFSSEKAMMTTIHQINDEYIGYIKGAPEKILEKAGFIQDGKEVKKITEKDIETVEKQIKAMNKEALRTLGFAFKKVTKEQVHNPVLHEKAIEKDLVFVGIMGQKDPLREEVIPAIADCRRAGIRPIMITGDHHLTAFAIAKELGMVTDESEVMEGSKLDLLNDEQLREKLRTVSVFARVLPKDKLRIIEILKQDADKVIAVTGDGVNDSLAIKSADIGIAMGIEGTDVTREVADMILQDDNFATIVNAVRQGRVIFANLVKFIRYLLSCNISEVIVVFFAVLIGLPIPLIPIQLLWVNLITDGLPALALGVDPAEKGVMNRAPRNLNEGILSYRRWLEMILEGFFMATVVFFIYIQMNPEENLALARTSAFITLCTIQLIHALSNRSETESLFKLGVFSNRSLIYAIVGSFLLQLLVVYTPFGNTVFKSVPLPLSEWGIIVGVSFVPFVGIEIMKYLKRKYAMKIVY